MIKSNSKKSEIMSLKMILFLAVVPLFLTFITAPLLEMIFTSSSYGLYNQTQANNFGVGLKMNTSAINLTEGARTSLYNYSQGDFNSFVFYNITSTYWNTTLSLADSTGGNEVYDLCSADANCVSYWDLDTGNTDANPYNDEKGSFDGVPRNTNNATGISSGAMYFNGTSWLNVSDVGSLRSISYWIIPTTSTTVKFPFTTFETKHYFIDWGLYSGFTQANKTYLNGKETSYSLGSELLTNGGLETGAVSPWASSVAGGASVAISVNTTNPYAGTYSLRLAIANDGGTITDVQAIHNTAYSITAGNLYKVQFAVRGDTSFTGAQMLFRIIGSPYTTISTTLLYDINTTWTYHTYYIYALATSTDTGLFMYQGNLGTGNIHWDAFTVKQVTLSEALDSGWNHVTTVLNDDVDANNFFIAVGRNQYYKGTLDEVLIYNDSLTDSEVESLYKAGLSQHANTNITLQTRTATSYNLSDANLVSQWDFNDGNGNDSKGLNNGTVTGAVFNEGNGTVGYGGYFDGSGDYINMSNPASLSFGQNQDFSASVWVRSSNLGRPVNNQARVISKQDADDPYVGYWVYVHNDTGIVNGVVDMGASTVTVTSTTNVKDGAWHHLAWTLDRDGDTNLYVDGVQEDTDATTTDAGSLDVADNFLIGGQEGLNRNFTGSIDEVRIYNRSLTASEVLDLYQMGSNAIQWGDWNDEGKMSDGVADTSSGMGNFFQYKTVFNTNNTNVSAYLLNYSIAELLDATDPNATLNTPINNSYANYSSPMNFTANLSDTFGVKNATLNVYNQTGLFNSTSTTFAEGTITTTVGIVVTILEGVYDWFYHIFDWGGNEYITGNYTVTAAYNLSACGNLDAENKIYFLANNVSSTGTCFNIMANNITLDCQGKEINFSTSVVASYGINITNQNFTTIKNCIIKSFSNSPILYALYLNGAKNTGFTNNTLQVSGISGNGVHIIGSSDSNLFNNNIMNLGAAGMFFDCGCQLNNLSSNTINVSASTGTGLRMDSADYFTIFNNTITTSSGYGIFMRTSSNSHSIFSNTITTNGNSAYGILLDTCSYSNISNNRMNSSQTNSYVLTGSSIQHYNHTIDSTNLAEGKPINYTFNADNIVYDSLNNNYGQIIFAYSRNITIKNSNITDDGINFFYTNTSIIYNNDINTSKGYGIWLYSYANSNNISNNNVNTSGSYGYGVYLSTSSANNILFNNNINTSGNTGYGVYLRAVLTNNVSSNTINSLSNAIYLASTADSNIMDNNFLRSSGSSGFGIAVTSSSSCKVSNNTINTLGSSAHGLYFNAANSNVLINNTVNVIGSSAYGIQMQGSGNNNTFLDMDINTNNTNGYGFYITEANQNFTILNSVINSSSAGVYDFYIAGAVKGGEWNLTNVTRADGITPVNISWVAGANGTLNMLWYAEVYANYTNSSNASGINISAWNVNGALANAALTASDGKLKLPLVEYKRNSTSGTSYTYYSNYTLNATKNDYSETTSVNISANKEVLFTLDATPPNATLLTPPNATYASNGTTINFTANLTDVHEGVKNATLNVVNTENTWLDFDGDGDYVNAGNGASLLLDKEMTISGWIKMTTATGTNTLVSRSYRNYELIIRTNYISFSKNNGSTTWESSNLYTTGATINNGAWHHVSLTFNGNSGNNLSFYLDGAYQSSTTTANSSLYYGTDSLTIGSRGTGNYFNGSIDEVRIYNRSLSQTEITQIYREGTKANYNLPSSGLVAWYDFNEGSGTNLIDKAGYDNNGTITGAVYTSTEKSQTWTFAGDTLTATVGVVVNLVDGIYNWFLNIFDFAGNQYTTGNYTITIDTVAPNVSFVDPTPENGSYLAQNSIYMNYSVGNVNNFSNNKYSFIDSDNSLVGWWRFETGSNSTFTADEKGINNGTVSGATLRDDGRFGKTYGFDGVDDKVDVNSLKPFTSSQAHSYFSWVYINQVSGMLWVINNGKNTEGDSLALATSSGLWKIRAYYKGVSYYEIANSAIVINQWNHVGFVYDGVSNFTFYLNGNSDGTQLNETSWTNETLNPRIGADRLGTNVFNGSIDEVMIFNRSLSAEEVVALYNATQTYHNFTSQADGTHTFKAYAVDQAGNKENTTLREISVDTSYPTLDYGAGTASNNSYVANLTINLSTTESNDFYQLLDFDNSLVGWWRFETGNSTKTYDEKGINNGTVTGATLRDDGRFGKTYGFDGVDDNVNLGSGASLNITGNITISTWIRPAKTPFGGFDAILVKGAGTRDYWLYCSGGDDELSFDIHTDTGIKQTPTTDANLIQDTWNNVVAQVEGNTTKVYVNGILRGSISFTGTRISSATVTNIGKGPGYFNGSIDEVIIFNRSLSVEEVRSLYNATAYRYNKTFTASDSVLTDGSHSFKGYVVDQAGNKNETETRIINADNTWPAIEFGAGTLADGVNVSQNYVFINTSITDLNMKNVTWNFNGTSHTFGAWDNLVLLMNFDNLTGENNTFVKDWSGNNNDGTAYDTFTYGAGKYDKAGVFDGVDDYVSGYDLSFTNQSAYSISLWINPKDLTGAQGIIGKFTPYYEWDLRLNVDDLVYNHYDTTGNGFVELTTASDLVLVNQWYNVVVTIDFPNNVAKLYMNGLNYSSDLSIEGIPKDRTQFFDIGRAYSWGYFNGSIDEVMIFNTSLTAEEVAFLYNSTIYKYQEGVDNKVNIIQNFTGLADGDYTYNVSVRDKANNLNQTGRTITLDVTAPSATLNTPLNNTYTNITSQNLTANLSDVTSGIKNATLWISGDNDNHWLNFDGVDDYVDVGSDIIAAGNDSLCFWFKALNSGENNAGRLFDNGNTLAYLSSSATIVFSNDAGSTSVQSSTFTYNFWYQMCAVRNSTGYGWLYINGQLNNSGNAGAVSANANLILGNNAATSRTFNGSIDEVRIYNRSLTSSEINTIYASGMKSNSALDDTGLVAWYDFEDASGSVLSDKAGYDNNGTITGATWESLVGSHNIAVIVGQTASQVVGTVIQFVEGIFTWFYQIFDFAGNQYNTGNYTLTVDTTYPSIAYNEDTTADKANLSQSWINVNYTVNDTNDAYSFIDYDSSLVGWWRFETGNSTKTYDEKGINNGTVTGATLRDDGRFGKAYGFDGVDDKVTIANSPSVNVTEAITISAWVKSNEWDEEVIIRKENAYILYETGNKLDFYLYGPNYRLSYPTSALLNVSQWYFIVATYDKSYMKTYVNGAQINSSAQTTAISTSTSPLMIGAEQNGAYPFNGSIDEVMIFNRSLSAEEVVALYNATQTYHNFTSQADGTHTFKAYAVDQAGQMNSTATRTVTLDTNAPNATLISPTNNTYTNITSQNLTANLSDVTSGIKNATLWISGDNDNHWLNFDGVDDYARIASSSSLNSSTTEMTIGFWIKPTGTTGFALRGFNGAGNRIIFSDSKTGFYTNTVDGLVSGSYSYTNNGAVPVNQWTYVIYRFNSTSHDWFVNGNFDKAYANSSVLSQGSSDLTIGGVSPYFNGSIDEVRIYNRSLTTSEISQIYASGMKSNSALNDTGLAAWYDFEDASGSVLSDKTGNGNNGTITGATWESLVGSHNIAVIVGQTASQVVGTVIQFVEGIFTWFYQIFDFAGNQYNTGNYTLTVDTTYPVPSFVDPTPGNNTGRSIMFWINVSITEPNLANVTLTFTGQANILCNRTSISLSNAFSCDNVNATVYNYTSNKYVFLFNKTGLTAGTSYYYQLNATDFTNQKNNTESRIIKGNDAPTTYALTYSPTANDSIDPGTQINIIANLSDNEWNLDTVLLQWKNSTDGANWNNITMTNLTEMGNEINHIVNQSFNASFTTPTYEGDIYFRVFANDTMNEAKNSSLYTLSNRWDCTWNIDTTGTGYNLESTGGFYQDKALGNVTIRNTGDIEYTSGNCSLVFGRNSASASWYTGTSYYSGGGQYLNFSLAYYLNGGEGLIYKYNGSSVSTLTLNPSENKTLEISGNFPLLTSVATLIENPYFIVSSNRTDTETGLDNVTITMQMVITPGAYLETGIEPSSQNVYLTPGNFSIAGYVKDVVDSADNANNTAYNVQLNVSLDSTLTSLFVSGELNKSIGVLNNTNKNYSNLTFVLNSVNIVSLTPSTVSLQSYAYGYENSTGNLTLISHTGNQTILNSSGALTFVCYPNVDSICVSACVNDSAGLVYDPDCSLSTTTTTTTTTSGGGGGGSGGGSSGKVEKSEAAFELVRGEEQSFELELKNKYPYDMTNVKIDVEGINSEYLKLETDQINLIPVGEIRNVRVRINAPAYFTARNYTLIFNINADLVLNGTIQKLTDKKQVILYILDLSRSQAYALYNEAESMVAQMNASNMILKEVNILFNELNASYENVDFNNVKSLNLEIKRIYENAFEAKSLLEELNESITQKEKDGISVIESKKLMFMGEVAYNRGDYKTAIERLKEAKLTFALETKGEFNAVYYVKNNPLESLGILILVGFIGFTGTTALKFQLYKKKLKILRQEEVLLLELMKVVQRECFENSRMSMEEYEEAMAQYEKRLNETISEKIQIETALANLLKFKGKSNVLTQEKKRLVELIKKAQDDYLNKGNIETRVYENMLKSYTKRLSEVEEEIATTEATEALKQHRKFKKQGRVK